MNILKSSVKHLYAKQYNPSLPGLKFHAEHSLNLVNLKYSLGNSVFQRTNPVIVATPKTAETRIFSPFNCRTTAIVDTLASISTMCLSITAVGTVPIDCPQFPFRNVPICDLFVCALFVHCSFSRLSPNDFIFNFILDQKRTI